jgi:hypothetical protein
LSRNTKETRLVLPERLRKVLSEDVAFQMDLEASVRVYLDRNGGRARPEKAWREEG